MDKKIRKCKKGQVNTAVGAVIFLVVGIGISVMVLVFVSSLSGQTYDIVEDDIAAISNTTIRNSINGGIVSSFEALETTGDYMPLVVLAFIIVLILGLIVGLTAIAGGGGARGGAL